MFSCEFCEISHSAFFQETFGRLLLHKYTFCLLSHLSSFQKQCHTFPIEYFLGLIFRLGARVSSRFQNFSETPTTQSSIATNLFLENS